MGSGHRMSLARNVATVGFATMLSRVLGFVRDMLIAALFGAGVRADAFFVAFQVANLVRRLLAEGALNAALVPLFLRARDRGGEAAAGAFVGRLIGTAIVGLTALAGLCALLMPIIILLLAPGFTVGGPRAAIAVELGRLMLPYLVFAGPLAVLIGVLNANNRFAMAAFTTAAFNAAVLVALAIIMAAGLGNSDASVRLLAIGIAVAGALQLMLVGVAVWIGSERVSPIRVSLDSDIRRFLSLAIPGLIANGIPQITIIVGVMVASSSTSAVSWLYYANRLMELPLGIVGIAIGTVLIPVLTHALRSGERSELAAAESRGLELALGLALPATVALIVLAHPIVQVLFERGAFTVADTAATTAGLVAFAAGLPGHVLVKMFSPIFFAREDTTTPMLSTLAGLAVAVVGSLILFPALGHVGVAAAISLSGWTTAGVLAWLIARRIGFSLDADARRRLPRIVAASLVMGVALAFAWMHAQAWLAGRGAMAHGMALLLLVALGLGSYGVCLRWLGVASMRDVIAVGRRSP
jgi:putative peptidoglycan lipid II flippase